MRVWWWKLCAWISGRHRITGPEDNAAVTGWFFRGEEKRSKGSTWSEAFRERANAPRS